MHDLFFLAAMTMVCAVLVGFPWMALRHPGQGAHEAGALESRLTWVVSTGFTILVGTFVGLAWMYR